MIDISNVKIKIIFMFSFSQSTAAGAHGGQRECSNGQRRRLSQEWIRSPYRRAWYILKGSVHHSRLCNKFWRNMLKRLNTLFHRALHLFLRYIEVAKPFA